MKDVQMYLNQVCSGGPLAEKWGQLNQLYEKRLWHELTVQLLKFVNEEHFKQNGGLIELYEQFLSDFEHRINPLSLVELILVIAEELSDHEKALALFQKTQDKVKGNTEGKVLCMTAMGLIHLKQNNLEEVKQLIKDAQALLDTLDGITTVHGRFYDLSSSYSKVIGSYNEYYRDALRFLGCMDLTQLSEKELQQRAFNLSLAALLGNEVYNFGELLAHDVLGYLKKTENAWLVDVLFAFNSGNIQKFLEMKPQWSQQADLAANEIALMQKITLLCLMELSFKRKSTERSFSFDTISKETCLPINEIELLVIKALSLGLIKGSIDEVNQTVHVTWVQPRVLDKGQIQSLCGLLGTWSEKVKSSMYMVEDQAPELLVN